MQKQRPVITEEGLEELRKELEKLIHEKRPQVVERVSIAREHGDISENSEYTAAREELSFIDGRIVELEEIIHNSKVVTTKRSKAKVDIGSKVTVHVNGIKTVYTVVGEWEANPSEQKISHSSPLGQALMGKKVGEEIEVAAPAGKVRYKILKID